MDENKEVNSTDPKRENATNSVYGITPFENIVDTVKSIEITQESPEPKNFKVRDLGGSGSPQSTRMRSGTIDDVGGKSGHRHRDGKRKGASPTGRHGVESENGEDKIYEGKREVFVTARIIKRDNHKNCALVDTNDFAQAKDLIEKYKLGKPTGRWAASGYCIYREYEFDMAQIEK